MDGREVYKCEDQTEIKNKNIINDNFKTENEDELDRSKEADRKEDAEDEKPPTPPLHLQDAYFEERTSAINFHKHGGLKAIQAVVLAAGMGSRMTTLVSNTQKCLLPIATVPMLYFPIHMLQRAGFTECIVVVSSGTEEAVAEMAQHYGLNIRLDIHTVDPKEDPGTLDSLRHILPCIESCTSEVLIVSSDLVSDVSVRALLANHRYKNSVLTMLTTTLSNTAFTNTPGLKQRSTIGPDILMESMAERVLAGAVCGGDYDDVIDVPFNSQRSGGLLVCMDVVDAHLYVMDARVLRDYVLSPTSPCTDMTSLKAEVVPHLIAQQHKVHKHPDLLRAARRGVPATFSAVMDAYNSAATAAVTRRRGCSTFHYDGGICVRANTIPAYWHLNTRVPPLLGVLCPDCPVTVDDHSLCDVPARAVVRGSTLVGAGASLSERTTVTDSCVGRGCTVGPGCRLTNTVLMDGVQLSPGCVIENSLVCCTVDKEKCTIKNCIVASARTLQAKKTVVGDTLECTQFFSA